MFETSICTEFILKKMDELFREGLRVLIHTALSRPQPHI